jgi:hypothetical protein
VSGLCPPLSDLTHPMAPPHRPSPTSARRFKTVAAATASPSFYSFSLLFPGRTGSPDTPPHLPSTTNERRTPARTGFHPHRATAHHSLLSTPSSLRSPPSTDISSPPCVPLELQDLAALLDDHRSCPPLEHRCPKPASPPRRCAATLGEPRQSPPCLAPSR